MSNDIDKLVNQAEGKLISKQQEEEAIRAAITEAEEVAVKRADEKREDKVRSFSLDIDLEDSVTTPPPTDWSNAEPSVADEEEEQEMPKKQRNGCLGKIIYLSIVLLIAVAVAYFLLVFLIDSTGLNKSNKITDVEIPQGAGTQQIAEILAENDVIDQPLCFRIYAKFSKADGKFQQGTFPLSADMGYAEIVTLLQTTKPRPNTNVTITEGMTVEEIAVLLQEKEVCSAQDFCAVVNYGKFDYDFIDDIPWGNNGRMYRLEGYLFPDTYNFYLNSEPEAVINRMLSNLDKKIDDTLRAKMTAQDMTLDELLVFASLIQGEAAQKADMEGVSRVLYNRIAHPGYPKLELCSTRDYVNSIRPLLNGLQVSSNLYNTYECVGMPAGAINNPGLDAINAVFNPSTDDKVMDCYFFATDYDTGITYFSKTFAQHESICRRYGIGAYG